MTITTTDPGQITKDLAGFLLSPPTRTVYAPVRPPRYRGGHRRPAPVRAYLLTGVGVALLSSATAVLTALAVLR